MPNPTHDEYKETLVQVARLEEIIDHELQAAKSEEHIIVMQDQPQPPSKPQPTTKKVRNRRLKIMGTLPPDYFSPEKAKREDPALYQAYVGTFHSESANTQPFPKDMSLVSRIYHDMESEAYRNEVTRLAEQRSIIEYDSDDSENGLEDVKDDPFLKKEMEEELVRILKERFLSGQDTDFDYTAVDFNSDYDDLEFQRMQDEEDYFNSD
jgi:Coiled-coil domain containing protein (DUF2052)